MYSNIGQYAEKAWIYYCLVFLFFCCCSCCCGDWWMTNNDSEKAIIVIFARNQRTQKKLKKKNYDRIANNQQITYSSGDGWWRTMWIIRPGGYNGLCSVKAIELSFGCVLAFRAVYRSCETKQPHKISSLCYCYLHLAYIFEQTKDIHPNIICVTGRYPKIG